VEADPKLANPFEVFQEFVTKNKVGVFRALFVAIAFDLWFCFLCPLLML